MTRKSGSGSKPNVEVHDSTGNIFEDMSMPDAQERLAKAELARVIRKALEGRGLTQAQAAELLGVKQPDVSDLVRGKLARFSRERLERFLNALDLDVRVQVGPKPSWKRRAGISVEVVDTF
jgi:predicted XRE-type DNA-binding protein